MSIFQKYIVENKKKIYVAGGVALGIVSISLVWLGFRNNAFAVSVEGKVVGIIKTKEEAQGAYDEVVKKITDKEGIPFTMNETLEVEAVHASKEEVSTYEDLTTAIEKSVSYQVEGYEVVVDGVPYAVVGTKEQAEQLLHDIAKAYAPNNGEVTLAVAEQEIEEVEKAPEHSTENVAQAPATSNQLVMNETITPEASKSVSKVTISEVKEGEKPEEEEAATPEGEKAQTIERNLHTYDFNEEIIIKSCFLPKEEILTLEEAGEALTDYRYETFEYELQEGDNIWDLAVANQTTQERIMALNPEITDETAMQIGQVIKLEKGVPILSITTIEEATFKELIPGEIQYRPSEQFYEGETKVIVDGNDGMKELTVEVTKVNGKEVSRKTCSEKILSEAKVTVIAYGVKEKESEMQQGNTNNSGSASGSGSGSQNSGNSNSGSSNSQNTGNNSGSSNSTSRYIHPLKGAGRISSTYGPRWGTFHYGIDYAAPAGTPIYASRAGKVIYSGYNSGGYGKLIIIEHNDGTQSYYAHCSSLYVNVGKQVGQGERIAGVGSTGDSTGNHLHFEIRVNGRPVNPANYL